MILRNGSKLDGMHSGCSALPPFHCGSSIDSNACLRRCPQPVRIVADTRLSIPSHVKLVKTAKDLPVWLLATRSGSVGNGIVVIDCRQGEDGWVDMRDARKHLAQRGINWLLVEGGSYIARSFLEANLVQRVELYRAPNELGPQGVDAFAGLDWRRVSRRFRIITEEKLGVDTLTVYEKPT